MTKNLCDLSLREATSAIGIVPMQSLRTELRITAVQHPVLTRVLETVSKKAQAEIILALAERGARETFFFDPQHTRNSADHPPTLSPVAPAGYFDENQTNGSSEVLCHIPS